MMRTKKDVSEVFFCGGIPFLWEILREGYGKSATNTYVERQKWSSAKSLPLI
jgi:hypothetical protein